MKFIALKTCEGGAKGRISFCCKALKVTRQGFHDYLKNRNKPWKHEELAAKMMRYCMRMNATIHTAGSECIRRCSLNIRIPEYQVKPRYTA